MFVAHLRRCPHETHVLNANDGRTYRVHDAKAGFCAPHELLHVDALHAG